MSRFRCVQALANNKAADCRHVHCPPDRSHKVAGMIVNQIGAGERPRPGALLKHGESDEVFAERQRSEAALKRNGYGPEAGFAEA